MRMGVTSIGMISSVGRNAVTSCASIRAGLSRPVELDYHDATDVEAQEVIPLTAYPIRGFTEGFLLTARWVRMAVACLRDLMQATGVARQDDAFWAGTGLCVALPPGRSHRFDTVDEPVNTLAEVFLERLLRAAGIVFDAASVGSVEAGHAGTALALQKAANYLEGGRVERVVILAVDSYLDPLTLSWLAATERLKVEGAAAGLRPGEAAAALLVENIRPGRKGRPEPLAAVAGLAFGQVRVGDADRAAAGRELARIWASVLTQSAAPKPFAGDVVVDLSGEPWRARDFGYAQMYLAELLDADFRWVVPAMSLGEVGAASGAVAACLAVQAFRRGYAQGRHTVVLSTSEAGEVGGIGITSAGPEP